MGVTPRSIVLQKVAGGQSGGASVESCSPISVTSGQLTDLDCSLVTINMLMQSLSYQLPWVKREERISLARRRQSLQLRLQPDSVLVPFSFVSVIFFLPVLFILLAHDCHLSQCRWSRLEMSISVPSQPKLIFSYQSGRQTSVHLFPISSPVTLCDVSPSFHSNQVSSQERSNRLQVICFSLL